MDYVKLSGIVTYLLYMLSSVYTQYHVIRKSGTEDYITLGSVFHTTTTNFRSECASLCASTSGCRSSMLMGHTCNLYTRACSCKGETISASLPSKYMVVVRDLENSTTAWEDAAAECDQHGMHLVAINSEEEHSAIASLLTTRYSQCIFVFTSGWSPIPGSKDMTDWRWNMTSYHTEPVNYTNWDEGQPDNYEQTGQDVIGLMHKSNYTWGDLSRYKKAKKIFCHVCECSDGNM